MVADVCKFWAYFAPLISETGFEGTHATVNGRKLIILLRAETCLRQSKKNFSDAEWCSFRQ